MRLAVIGLLLLGQQLARIAVAGPLEDATAAFGRGEYTTALPLYRSLAEQGNANIRLDHTGFRKADTHPVTRETSIPALPPGSAAPGAVSP
jgi:hypothetical protein